MTATIAFRHDDTDATLVGLRLPLLLSPESTSIPSVLGRDVLYRGPLHFDPAAPTVYFDAPKGSFLI